MRRRKGYEHPELELELVQILERGTRDYSSQREPDEIDQLEPSGGALDVLDDLGSSSLAQVLNRLVHVSSDGLNNQNVRVLIHLLQIVAGLLEVEAVPLIAVHEDSQRVGLVFVLSDGRTVVFDEQVGAFLHFFVDNWEVPRIVEAGLAPPLGHFLLLRVQPLNMAYEALLLDGLALVQVLGDLLCEHPVGEKDDEVAEEGPQYSHVAANQLLFLSVIAEILRVWRPKFLRAGRFGSAGPSWRRGLVSACECS